MTGRVHGGRPAASDAQALRRMKTQKQRDTRPELQVRRQVRELGHHYRLGNRDLPGSPDLANRSRKWAIFVHGCYWHSHPGCPRATIPKRNREFWVAKFAANRERDQRKEAELRAMGFTVLVIWECETQDPELVRQRLDRELP